MSTRRRHNQIRRRYQRISSRRFYHEEIELSVEEVNEVDIEQRNRVFGQVGLRRLNQDTTNQFITDATAEASSGDRNQSA